MFIDHVDLAASLPSLDTAPYHYERQVESLPVDETLSLLKALKQMTGSLSEEVKEYERKTQTIPAVSSLVKYDFHELDTDVIVADMDGTLVEPAKEIDPDLSMSPVKGPLIQWLEAGIRIDETGKRTAHRYLVVATGNLIERTKKKITDHIPPHLKSSILLSTNQGALLFYYDESKKDFVEDLNYRQFALKGGTAFDPQTSEKIIQLSTDSLNRFFQKVYASKEMQTELVTAIEGKLAFLLKHINERKGKPFTREELVNTDFATLPRIEVNTAEDGSIIQIATKALPSYINDEMIAQFAVDNPHVEIKRCKLTTMFNIKGVDKKLVCEYLNLNPSRAIALGDAPHENDFSLSQYENGEERKRMPFVSVCPYLSEVDPYLLHLHIGNTEKGTAAFMQALNEISDEHSKDGLFESPFEKMEKITQRAKEILSKKGS